jgi:hypothetical protein
MNGYTPDRPQRMAQMLAMQERNRSIAAPPGQRDGMPAMRPSLAYSGATPNTASGVSPSTMNFNGPQMSPQPGTMGMAPGRMGSAPMRQMGPPPVRSLQIGNQRRVSSPGMTTPQGGRYRGDFDDGAE